MRLGSIYRIQLWISFFFRGILLLAVIESFINKLWMVMFIATLTLSITFLPSLLRRNINFNLPTEMEFFMTLFVFAALFLGEIQNYYAVFPWWDTLLHGLSGIALGFVGFLIIFSLYNNNRIKASPIMIALFTFSFAMMVGAMWEIFEFAVDQIFNQDMQKGLVDTMWDLIMDTLGALLVSIIGFFYVRGAPSLIFHHFLCRVAKANPRFFKNL
ncbi:MAG: hypothetical protein R6V53_03580 [Candidatus Woesearchaeota archaeon]